ncbi:hypothetical protein Bca4012_066057 [Brassica carinata]
MNIPELPRWLYTLGEEPEAHNTISYHTDNNKLHTALREALTDDEFEELKESSLGVFIKFKEQGFGWASRLVHYMLSFKLDIKKKYEMWSLVGPEPLRFSLLEFENLTGLNCEYIEDLETPKCEVTKEMVSFWGMLGVHLEAGPTTDQIIAALKRCEDWSTEDRKRLAYLSIFTGFIEGRKFSTATRSSLARLVMDLERFENYPWGRVVFKVLMDSLWNKDITGCYTVDGFIQVLQVWVYTAMPELGASIGGPRANSPSPPILAYGGSRGRRSMKKAILRQPSPQTKQPTPQKKQPTPQTKKPTPQKKQPTPQKKQPTPQTKKPTPQKKQPTPQAKQSEDKADGVSSKEIVAVTSTDQPSVASTDQQPSVASIDQQPSVASTVSSVPVPQSSVPVSEPSLVVLDKTAPTASVRARSERAKKPSPTQISPYTAEKKKDKVAAYNPFQPVNRPKLKELAGWLKTDPHYFTKHDEKPRTSPTWWYHILRTAREWLEDCHIDAWINVLRQRYQENPQAFRSERMCFLDHNFSQSWRDQYKFFKVSVPDHKGLGRALPGGAWNYYDGSVPSFCQSNKVWGEDIDDIYAPVNLNNAHWVDIWISIPKRHIVVWDSIPSSTAAEAWDEIMLPFLEMVPYLLVECAATDEIRVKYGLEPYTYERQLQDVPTANNGDCGVYALKYIECHALGVPFNSKDFARTNAKNTRDKMAVDIWTELLDQHLKENVDGDKFVGMYD